jgi:hypothetical protein
MRTRSSDPYFTGWLPYGLTAPTQRAQALAHTRQLLQQQFPLLTDEQWAELFAAYKPMLWVEDETQTAVLDENALLCLANWIDLYHTNSEDKRVHLYGHEAHYLARIMTAYSQLASGLVADDPELTKPESVGEMRALFYRLSVGNTVAEHIYRVCQVPSETVH